ncbi:armadillo-type protein [Syncephalis fuscata]|nr:armadillo-type protein [Syncephalis fuscata]
MAAPEEDFGALPVMDRLEHKVWKARVSAYEELVKEFRIGDPDDQAAYRKYHSYLPKMAADSNAIAQESGLACLASFVENSPTATQTREAVLPILVEKCLGSSRAGTKKKAVDIFLFYCEIEVPDPVIECIISGLGHKLPKLVAMCVTSLREIVQAFGVRTFNVKPLLKVIPKMFAHTDKNVRAEASLLVVELYRWLGDALIGQLQELKPVQVKELTEQFEKLPKERPVQGRLLRSQQAAPEAEAEPDAAGGGGGGAGEADGDDDAFVQVDAYDLADPVDLLGKMDKEFYTHMGSAKWKDRKEALEALYAIANTVKLAPANYSELLAALAKRIGDANILVTILAAQCIECIAKGLREQFAQYKGAVISPLIEKLKEKKQNALDALRNALDAIFATITIGDIMEDVVTGSKHKNPNVRAETCRWLIRSLKVIKQPPGKAELKTYTDAMKVALDDSQADVREAALEALGTMMKAAGERAMLSMIDGMDKVKETKMREYFDKAEVKAKATAARPAPAPAKPAASAPSKPVARKPPPPSSSAMDMDIDPIDDSGPSSASAAAPPKPKPKLKPKLGPAKPKIGAGPPKKAAPAAAKSAPPPAPKKGSKPDEPIVYKFNPDTAQGMIEEAFPANILTDIANSNWKTRLAGCSAIHPELVIRMMSKKPGWKDNNFQVLSKVFGVIGLLATQSNNFTRACGALCISGMTDKLGDIKVKKSAGDSLTAIAEKISLQFVFSQVYDSIKSQKAPKAQSDALLWMQTTLSDFGIRGLAIRDLIEFAKSLLSSTNAAVRTNSIALLGVIRMFAGPDIRTFVQDVSPAVLTNIDAEFERVAALPPPQPTKGGGGDDGGDAGGSGGGGGSADVMDELFPRIDITSQIPNKLYKELMDANWKVRKEALDHIHGVATANTRLKPNLGNELIPALKGRLGDSNKSLVVTTCEIIGLLAKGMGKPFEKMVRPLLPLMLSNLNDTKAPVRLGVTSALDKLADECSLAIILPPAGTALEAEAPTLRKDLLKWLQERVAKAEGLSASEVDPIILPTLGCLMDRNADVRKAAQSTTGDLIAVVGFDRVRSKCNSLKNNGVKTVGPIVEGLRSRDTGKAAASAPTSKPASALAPPSTATSMSRSSSRNSSNNDRSISPGPGPARPGSPPKGLARPSNLKSKLALKRKLVAPGSSGIGGPRSGIPAPGSSSSAAAASSSSADGGGGGDAPILTSDNRSKDIRADKDRTTAKWIFDTPRKDIIQLLSDQMQPHFSSNIHSLCFSASHSKDKDWLNAISILDDCLVTDAETSFGISSEEMNQRIMANADLILKYLSIRLYDNGTTMQLRCMDLIEHLFTMLDEAGYRMTEYEANAFLPHFVNKLGEKNDTIRVRVRASLKQMTRICPASRIFATIMDHGLKSKNARTRAESLEELGLLIQRNNLTVCTPQKALPTIAAHIGDRDPAVRNGAMNAILQAYLLVGSAVHKYLGRISEKDKDMLEERFRRNKPPGFDEEPDAGPEEEEPAPIFSFQKARLKAPTSGIPAPGSGGGSSIPVPGGGGGSGIPAPGGGSLLYRNRPRPPTAVTPEPDHEMDMDIDTEPPAQQQSQQLQRPRQIPSRLQPRELGGSSLRRPQFGASAGGNNSAMTPPRQFGLQLNKLNLPQASDDADNDVPMETDHQIPADMPPTPQMPVQKPVRPERRAIEPRLLKDEINSGDSHRSIHGLKQLEVYLAEDISKIIPFVNELVKAITLQIDISFTSLDTESQTFVKLCKHLMNCLVQLFSKREIATEVTEDYLHQLLKELLRRLLDQSLQQWETGAQLTRALNILMIRILDNTRRDVAFSALLSVLQSSSVMLRTTDKAQIEFQTKFAELVMKCIWKLTKTLQDSIKQQELDTPVLLFNVHKFYVALPPAEWKRRVAERVPLGDMPQKTIKTILHEVKAAWGDQVLSQLTLIPDVEKSYLYSYLSHIIDPTRKRAPVIEDGGSRPGSRVASIPENGSDDGSTTGTRRAMAAEDRSDDRPPSTAGSSSSPSGDRSDRYGGSNGYSSTANRESPSLKSPTDPIHATLSQIFMKISTSERTKQGIMELYEFQRDHPNEGEAIETFLKKAGTFQSYIRRTLANIAADRGESLTSPSGSTPPISPSRSNSVTRRISTISDTSSDMSSSTMGGESDAYRQRLQRLQQMFGYQSQDSSPASSRPGSMIFPSRTPSHAALDATKRASVPIGFDYQVSSY